MLRRARGRPGIFRNRTYRHLFAAQVVALLGTGLLTVALALLAYDLAGASAGAVLGTALTVKIATYVLVSPLASALTARLSPRVVLVTADLVRASVAALLPFVDAVWQVYVLVVVLQAASATFTPTFQAVVPTVLPDEEDYTLALSWSRVAYDLESLASPVVAALLLTVVSFHDVFFGTVVGFLGSALLVGSVGLPGPAGGGARSGFAERVTGGVRTFVSRPALRGLLALDLVVAASTALVLVNTVVLARDTFGVGEQAVPVALACNGAGSVVAAVVVPALLRRVPDRSLMVGAAVLTVVSLGLAAVVVGTGLGGGWLSVLVLWTLMGALGALVSVPASRIVVSSSAPEDRQSLFSAHFSLSHACYLVTYPVAGWAGAALGQGWATSLLAAVGAGAVVAALWVWPARDDRLAR